MSDGAFFRKHFSSDIRLLSKAEVVRKVGRSFPTIWRWMRDGRFPRALDLNGRPVWIEAVVDQAILALPIRELKGDRSPKTTEEKPDETRE
jgi:predicted DNA-binding transcriptional regulator AlpA